MPVESKPLVAVVRDVIFKGLRKGLKIRNREEKVMAHFTSLGFVNTRKMFAAAIKGGFAVPAYNFNNMEQLQAIVTACLTTQSPVILQVSKGARDYADRTLLAHMGRGAIEMMKRDAAEKGSGEIPIALHLDHGDSFDLCVSCIETGFSSVMIDGSHLSYDENVELTRNVVDYAHRHDVCVEGELGVLAGVEDEVSAEHHTYTRPEEVEDFVRKTGVDSLAISIGTSHGAYKFKPGQNPQIRLDILREIESRIPGFPIVLHGSSSVPQDAVEKINLHGGRLKDSIGIPETQLREAARSSVCKINIDSDGRLVMTAKIREIFALKPEEFDPRKYLGPAREALYLMYCEKNRSVLGSAGHAQEAR
jgi:fructose-bisphosphate aldolase class II